MVETNTLELGVNAAPLRVSEWKRLKQSFFSRKLVIVGLLIIVIFFVFAIFANWLTPYDPYKVDISNTFQGPSLKHWLGTDTLGRDLLTRIIYGARTALTVGLIATLISSIIGSTLGMLSGYFGKWVSMIIMRATDTLMCMPNVLTALLIAAVLGSGIKNVMIAFTISTIPMYIRMMNGVVLSAKENDYILAARAMGASNVRIMFRHLLPNALPPIIVQTTLQLGFLIIAEAGLSYLGIGINPPTAAWGSMIREGVDYLRSYPILTLVPGIAVILAVFGFNLVGDGLRDALDPRLRGRL
jgi:peptide/nickel transport system permease protein